MDVWAAKYSESFGALNAKEFLEQNPELSTLLIQSDAEEQFRKALVQKRKHEDYEARCFTAEKKNKKLPLREHYIYAMVCDDMPHLVKIGITDFPYERLKEANKHNTYKPPSGYTYWYLIKVDNSLAYENSMKERFKTQRRKNPNNNCSEFFEIDLRDLEEAFKSIVGERIDVDKFEKKAEKKETIQLRKYIAQCVKNATPCSFLVDNPKKQNTDCFERYEKYKTATSLDQVQALGGIYEDIVHDYKKKFLTLMPQSS